jgi:2-keto-4-pentenoate hydratase/2-oxohepta-3-ene-1,7-dioic acid hydratase in catechol pathway
MRLVTYDGGSGARIGLLDGGRVVDARDAVERHFTAKGIAGAAEKARRAVPGDMTALLMAGLSPLAEAASGALHEGVPRDTVRLLAPVPRPGKVIGVGRNYGAHAAEGGLEAQEQPRLFTKVPSSVIGPHDPIAKPALVRKLDWEAELAVVIGRTMRDVAEERALDYVAGYTVLNDVSAREFQFDVKPPQTSFAKSMDGFCPMGPCLVTPDEIRDPADLDLRCWVNDRLMQQGNTHDMIFSTPYILSYVSRYMTLEPGDVIATGTPDGVGAFRKPPVWLQPGDRVRIEIPPIGVIDNPVT